MMTLPSVYQWQLTQKGSLNLGFTQSRVVVVFSGGSVRELLRWDWVRFFIHTMWSSRCKWNVKIYEHCDKNDSLKQYILWRFLTAPYMDLCIYDSLAMVPAEECWWRPATQSILGHQGTPKPKSSLPTCATRLNSTYIIFGTYSHCLYKLYTGASDADANQISAMFWGKKLCRRWHVWIFSNHRNCRSQGLESRQMQIVLKDLHHGVENLQLSRLFCISIWKCPISCFRLREVTHDMPFHAWNFDGWSYSFAHTYQLLAISSWSMSSKTAVITRYKNQNSCRRIQFPYPLRLLALAP